MENHGLCMKREKVSRECIIKTWTAFIIRSQKGKKIMPAADICFDVLIKRLSAVISNNSSFEKKKDKKWKFEKKRKKKVFPTSCYLNRSLLFWFSIRSISYHGIKKTLMQCTIVIDSVLQSVSLKVEQVYFDQCEHLL